VEAAGAALVEAAAEEVSEALVEAAGAAPEGPEEAPPEAQAENTQVIKRDRSRPAAKIFLFIKSPPLNCPAYTGQTVVKL